jgi:hypothetical protein
MELQEIQEILNTWNLFYKRILEFEEKKNIHENDPTYALKAIRQAAAYITQQIPILKAWGDNYLEVNRTEIFLRYWLNHVYKHMDAVSWRRKTNVSNHNKLREPFRTHWAKYFSMDDFEKALCLAEYAGSKKFIENCDDEEILAIHKDKVCNGYWWGGCDYCEPMEAAWHSKLYKIFDTPNIFLNESLHEEFIEAHKHLIIDCEPPKTYLKFHSTFTYDEAISYINEARDYHKQGQTVNQCVKHMLNPLSSCVLGWFPYYSTIPEKPLDIFFSLWSYLDVLPYIIEKDLEECTYIERLISS